MEWLDYFNKSIAYVEDNLVGEIEVAKVAQLAHCSSYHYQRIFSYIAGVTLGEYIRRRKMSLASVDLQQGAKVIDVALKYGYDSPTSFNRVFKSIQGLTPKEAKQSGAKLTSYPMLTFQLTVKGVQAMEYQIIDKALFFITGVSLKLGEDMEAAQKQIPQFWNEVSTSGELQELLPLMDQNNPGVLGASMITPEVQDEWEYVIGVVSEQETKEFSRYEIPAAKWAVFSGMGPIPGAIQELQQQIFTEWLPTSGFEYAELPDIELYLDADPQNAQFQIWLPIRAK
ncbi:AraC family transcriptional regulator [Enterococcus dongliensis]|uniref:AraC family transcriptional regulator n=1 Tax=Enterococcus dongliensis TaxID=2559925 RepID=UPI00288D4AED|nr:effector binding domain-containing protein [Enterococcus dongliensis]MDT2604466.1 effector binding domain-containing protein [Enterococcus dongliensis]MDT2645471.1 effector binding domain-containing protein [Enterococcus dongliensis]MDT2671881.1 effector binding domain-containing protein [Enterococcus dongliensis]MDT2711897.1 effector binding domain-containing protein [Enterococcus dongliensis]